jgi:hypothetical protein
MKKLVINIFLLCFYGLSVCANTITWSSSALSDKGGNSYSYGTSFYNSEKEETIAVQMYMDIYDLVGPGLGTLGFVGGTASWAEKYYLVNQGDLVDENLVNTGSPVFDNAVWSPTPYEMSIFPNQTFMLGYWINSDDLEDPKLPTVGDCYGWAQFTWTGSDLILDDFAGVSGAGGIYAGTWDVIPEPATIILFLLGGFCIFIKKKFSKE